MQYTEIMSMITSLHIFVHRLEDGKEIVANDIQFLTAHPELVLAFKASRKRAKQEWHHGNLSG
jgi:hypothetical protein